MTFKVRDGIQVNDTLFVDGSRAVTAASVNKVTITAPATSSTLTIANGKTLTASNTLTFTGTDGSSAAFGAGGTVAYTANKLNAFAATTSSELAGVISDETGSGKLVFGTSPDILVSLTTTSTAFDLINANAVTVNFAGASTALTIGAPTGTTTVRNNLTISGNLTVNGTTTTTNATTVTVDDPIITLGGDTAPTVDDGKDRGVEFRWFNGTAKTGFFGFQDSTQKLVFIPDGTNTGEVFSGSLGTLAVGTIEATSMAVAGVSTITVNSSNPALKITQTGTGNALVVEDSASTDSTPFVIDASGNVIHGNATAVALNGVMYPFQLHNANPWAGVRWSGALAGGASCLIGKSRGSTVGDYTIVVQNDDIGQIIWAAADGAQLIQAASLLAEVDGTPGLNDMPGRLVFSTTADGASTPVEAFRVDSKQNIGKGGGSTIQAEFDLRGNKVVTEGTVYTGFANSAAITDATATTARAFATFINAGSGATLGNLLHYEAGQRTFVGTATNQIGYNAANSLTGAANNSGFISAVPIAGSPTITNIERTSNIAKATCSAAPSLLVGSRVYVYIGTAGYADFNGYATVTAVDATSFSYANTGVDVTTVAVSGTGYNRRNLNFNATGNAHNFFGGTVRMGAADFGLANLEALTQLNVSGTNNSTSGITQVRTNADATGPTHYMGKSRSATAGGHTIVQNGDALGTLDFRGSDGHNYIQGASIYANVDGTPGLNDMPTRLTFSTTPDGSASVVERMRITSAGNVGIGVDPGASRFAVVNTAGDTEFRLDSNGYTSLVLSENALSSSADIQFRKARGGYAAKGIVSSGDTLGFMAFIGHNGVDSYSAHGASMTVQVDGTPSATSMPGRIVFSTSAAGSIAPTERMRIDSAGNVGFGATPGVQQSFLVQKPITGAVSAYGIVSAGQIQSDVTTSGNMFQSVLGTATATFSVTYARHFYAQQGTIGAGSTVTNQYGFLAESSLTGATNNYGFYGNIAAATGRWNFYAGGTADNYFAGKIGIGDTTPSVTLDINATDAIRLPVGTTAQQPAGVQGYLRSNSDTDHLEHYNGTAYETIATIGDALAFAIALG